MDDNYENWMQLAAQIIIEVIEDYRISRDRFRRDSLIKWFDTPYGNTICDLAGMNSEYIKREVQNIENHIRNDNQGVKKVYPATGKESKYSVKGYNLQKEPYKEGDQQSNAGGDRLGIINKQGRAVTGYRLARKSELQRRARELEYFNQWRGSETKHIARTEDMKKYQKFMKNHPKFADYSYQDWKNMVENLGAMAEELESYGYVSENMIQLDKEIKERKNKKQLMDVVDKVKSQAKGQGWKQEQLVEALRGELFG